MTCSLRGDGNEAKTRCLTCFGPLVCFNFIISSLTTFLGLNLYICYKAASAASHVTTCRGDGNEANLKTCPLTCFGPLVSTISWFRTTGMFHFFQLFFLLTYIKHYTITHGSDNKDATWRRRQQCMMRGTRLLRWVHRGAPRFEPQVQVQSLSEPAPYMGFRFGSPAALHPEPWVRYGFGEGSRGSGTGPRPV
jgi:hypothetical protein